MVINHVNDNHFKGLNIFTSDYLFTYFYYRQANADVSHPLSFLKPACQVCYPTVILFSYYILGINGVFTRSSLSIIDVGS
jgi:hypothetical protein